MLKISHYKFETNRFVLFSVICLSSTKLGDHEKKIWFGFTYWFKRYESLNIRKIEFSMTQTFELVLD